MASRDEITARYRKLKDWRWGRLYWKRNDRRGSRRFDSDDVAIIKDGGLTTHYKNITALIEDIADAEYRLSVDWVEKHSDPMFWN